MQIVAGHALRKVVFKSESETKPVEPARNQQIQISLPEILVVEPRLVLDFAAKISPNAAHFVGGLFQNWLPPVQLRSRIRAESHSLRHLQQSVDTAARIAA